MSLWKRAVETRAEVSLCEQQYGFTPRESSSHANTGVEVLIEKVRKRGDVFL